MKPILRIIIPTWNNPDFLNPCVMSILRTGVLNDIARLTIVNNGKQPIKELLGGFKGVDVLEPGENLGWEGGLKYALDRSDEEFVCFQNDDTFIPMSSIRFYQRLLMPFADKNVGAVGPSTTVAAGVQSIYANNTVLSLSEVAYLIFFTVMIRREHLDAVGGVDTSLPGGDDLDLSIRLRKAGKKILVDPQSFLIHHGFKTGTRVYGDGYAGVKNGWNSPEMGERTNFALIQKHGFKSYIEMLWTPPKPYTGEFQAEENIEGRIVSDLVTGEDVVELGCGGQKTVPHALGVDRIPKGEKIPHLDTVSVADVVSDADKPLPFGDMSKDTIIARHILEHLLDTVSTLKEWNRILKMGGRMIIAVPDEAVTSGIPLNAEHCHAFTKESLKSVAELCGFQEVVSGATGNGISFVACFEKVEHVTAKREAVLV